MRTLIELPGGRRLFRYETDGSLCNLTGARLNSYVAEYVGDEFTAKDFRSWGGAMALAEHRPSEDETDAKRVVTGVMRVSPRSSETRLLSGAEHSTISDIAICASSVRAIPRSIARNERSSARCFRGEFAQHTLSREFRVAFRYAGRPQFQL